MDLVAIRDRRGNLTAAIRSAGGHVVGDQVRGLQHGACGGPGSIVSTPGGWFFICDACRGRLDALEILRLGRRRPAAGGDA